MLTSQVATLPTTPQASIFFHLWLISHDIMTFILLQKFHFVWFMFSYAYLPHVLRRSSIGEHLAAMNIVVHVHRKQNEIWSHSCYNGYYCFKNSCIFNSNILKLAKYLWILFIKLLKINKQKSNIVLYNESFAHKNCDKNIFST